MKNHTYFNRYVNIKKCRVGGKEDNGTKTRRIMISSLCEKRIGAISLSLVTVYKCDVRNSESPTGSIEGKKEAKRHPVSHAALLVSRRRDVCARGIVTIFKIIRKKVESPSASIILSKERRSTRKDFPTD